MPSNNIAADARRAWARSKIDAQVKSGDEANQ